MIAYREIVIHGSHIAIKLEHVNDIDVLWKRLFIGGSISRSPFLHFL